MKKALCNVCCMALGLMASLACGSKAPQAVSSPAEVETATDVEPAGGVSDGSATNSETSTARTAPCAGSRCLECGEGMCPPGMFCMNTSTGTGCGWLPACAKAAGCSCLAEQLAASCRCQSVANGAKVECD